MKTINRVLAAVLLLALWSFAPTLDAQDGTSVVNGVVYNDDNQNGVLDGDEEVVPGTTVSLLDADGNVVATTVTDENGAYSFPDVPYGEYRLLVEYPSGLVVESQPFPVSAASDAVSYAIPVLTRSQVPTFPFLKVSDRVANPANVRGPTVSPFAP